MTSRQVLLVVALVQGVLLGALIVLIILNRWFRLRHRAQVHPRRVTLDNAMRRWAAGGGPLAGVLVGFARLPATLAIDALVAWSARVPGERWRELAAALEHQWWARLVRANGDSFRWWKRMECARFLSVAAAPHDVARLIRLINDRHPAVHVAAVASLERIESAPLTLAALERLPRLAPTVQAYYAGMLRRSRPVVIQHLLKRLRRTDDPALPRLAEIQVARALGAFPHRESVAALSRLAADEAWEVRAQAARALGMIADPTTLPLVRDALRDSIWWVRLRAALALMRFGAAGRNALLEAEVGADTGARDTARMILGLPPQALAEFAA